MELQLKSLEDLLIERGRVRQEDLPWAMKPLLSPS